MLDASWYKLYSACVCVISLEGFNGHAVEQNYCYFIRHSASASTYVVAAVCAKQQAITYRRFRAARTGGSSADDPDARNARTGRGLARTADEELKRGLARTRADSRGLARTGADWRTRGASHATTIFW